MSTVMLEAVVCVRISTHWPAVGAGIGIPSTKCRRLFRIAAHHVVHSVESDPQGILSCPRPRDTGAPHSCQAGGMQSRLQDAADILISPAPHEKPQVGEGSRAMTAGSTDTPNAVILGNAVSRCLTTCGKNCSARLGVVIDLVRSIMLAAKLGDSINQAKASHGYQKYDPVPAEGRRFAGLAALYRAVRA